MSRWKPGILSQLVNNLFESLSLGQVVRTVVGRDSLGNVYYEEKPRGGEKAVLRGYIPSNATDWQRMPPEWESWLRSRRKLPPTETEIAENAKVYALRMQKVEALGKGQPQQSADGTEEAVGEKAKYPNIDVSSASGESVQHRPFPKYQDYEEVPGAAKQEEFRSDKKDV